jgi:hypothetical protein
LIRAATTLTPVRVVAATAAAVFLLVSPQPATSTGIDEFSELATVLDKRNKALVDNNRKAFLATTAPNADNGFSQRQEMAFDALQELPVAEASWTIDPQSVDISSGFDLESRYDADEAKLARVLSTVRFEQDTVASPDPRWVTFVRHGNTWSVASDTDGELVGLRARHDLWELQTTRHIVDNGWLVLFGGDSNRATGIAELIQVAEGEFEQVWGSGIDGGVVLIPDDNAVTSDLVAFTDDVSNFTAFVTYRTGPQGDNEQAGGARLVVNDEVLDRNSRASQIGTFLHELTHLATANRRSLAAPSWLHEGIAEQLRWEVQNISYNQDADTRLPASSDLTGIDDPAGAYASATSAVRYMDDEHGSGSARAIFDSLTGGGNEVGTPAFRLDRVMKDELGVGLTEFATGWQESS